MRDVRNERKEMLRIFEKYDKKDIDDMIFWSEGNISTEKFNFNHERILTRFIKIGTISERIESVLVAKYLFDWNVKQISSYFEISRSQYYNLRNKGLIFYYAKFKEVA